MIVPFIFSFLLAVAISLIATPQVIKLAIKVKATDAPDERKIHHTIMPRIGGLAIFISIAASFFVVAMIYPEFFEHLKTDLWKWGVLALCFVSIFALGFWDDLKPLSPEIKFGIQFLIAVLVYFAGFKISNITNPLGEGMLDVQFIDFPLTILWVVGITNAFNLIDGLDGLASGVGTIACISIFTVSAMSGQIGAALTSLMIAGALVGFLRYNFKPARIFLGDSGSLIIGFSLALLSIQSTAKISTGFALLFPILVLALPITDTLISMIRRLIGSFLYRNPGGKSSSLPRRIYGMFKPDKSHIHHQILSFGISHRNTVLLLYFISGIFAFGAFLFTQIETVQGSITITLLLAFILVLCIKNLRYHEIAIFNNGLMMPFYEKWILNRTAFMGLADLIFITISYSFSYALVENLYPTVTDFLKFENTLFLLLLVQIVMFWVTGLYREKMDQLGIGNALHITTTVFYTVGASAFVLSLEKELLVMVGVQFLILDFYFLLTFTLGFRMIYQALSFWFNRDKKTGESILIYGARENGTTILHKIINSRNNSIKVLGFLDDDPDLEGKLIYGYPILGGHWKLSKTHNNQKVDSIFICDNDIKSENLKRLRLMAQKKGIKIKKMEVSLHEIKIKPDDQLPSKKNMISTPVSANSHADKVYTEL